MWCDVFLCTCALLTHCLAASGTLVLVCQLLEVQKLTHKFTTQQKTQKISFPSETSQLKLNMIEWIFIPTRLHFLRQNQQNHYTFETPNCEQEISFWIIAQSCVLSLEGFNHKPVTLYYNTVLRTRARSPNLELHSRMSKHDNITPNMHTTSIPISNLRAENSIRTWMNYNSYHSMQQNHSIFGMTWRIVTTPSCEPKLISFQI
jgi:hypothetical protein